MGRGSVLFLCLTLLFQAAKREKQPSKQVLLISPISVTAWHIFVGISFCNVDWSSCFLK